MQCVDSSGHVLMRVLLAELERQGVEVRTGSKVERLVINDDGRIYLTQTRYKDSFVIRFQVGQLYTTEEDVLLAWSVIQEMATRLK